MLPNVSHLLLVTPSHRAVAPTSTTTHSDDSDDSDDDSDAGSTSMDNLTAEEIQMLRWMNLQAGLVDDRGHALDVDTDEEADAAIRRQLAQREENVPPAPAPVPVVQSQGRGRGRSGRGRGPAPQPQPLPPVRQPNHPQHQPRTFPPSRPEHGFRRPLVHPSRFDDPQERKDRVHNYIINYADAFYPAGTPLYVASRVLNVETGRLGTVTTVLNATDDVVVTYQEQGWGLRVETTPTSRLRSLAVVLADLPHRPWVIT